MSKQYLSVNESLNTQTTLSSKNWEQLQNSFAQVYEITDSDRREFELHKAAQQFDVPVDAYRKLFQNYSQAQLISGGSKAFSLLSKSPQKAWKLAFDMLSRLGWLSMIGVMITLSLQLIELKEREEYFRLGNYVLKPG